MIYTYNNLRSLYTPPQKSLSSLPPISSHGKATRHFEDIAECVTGSTEEQQFRKPR